MSNPLLALALVACTPSEGGADGADGADGDDDGADGVTTPEPTTSWTAPPCVDDTPEPIEQPFEMAFEDVLGWPAMYHVPENPRGVVFLFHGTGGTAGQMNQLHYARMWAIYAEAGFGVVATESQNRTMRTWDLASDPDRNEDLPHLEALRAELISRGLFTESTPMWAWGFSNGAIFAPVFADLALQLGWPIRGATSHNGNGPLVELPTFITSAENDDITAAAYRSHQDQVDAGFPSVWIETLEFPWTRDAMLINAFYDEEESSAVFDELVDFQLIDETGARIGDVERVDALMNMYESNSVLPGPNRVTPHVRVAWATHRATSAVACEERDFMIEHL